MRNTLFLAFLLAALMMLAAANIPEVTMSQDEQQLHKIEMQKAKSEQE